VHSKDTNTCGDEAELVRACAEEAQAIVRKRPSRATLVFINHMKQAGCCQCRCLSQSKMMPPCRLAISITLYTAEVLQYA
jgi:hypothetical protein